MKLRCAESQSSRKHAIGQESPYREHAQAVRGVHAHHHEKQHLYPARDHVRSIV